MEALIPRKGGAVPAPRKYPPELRERSVRLVSEAREQDQSLSVNQAVKRIGERVGVNPDTLRGWVKQSDIDAGRRRGTTTAEAAEIAALRREVKELKRANEILLAGGCRMNHDCPARVSRRGGQCRHGAQLRGGRS